VNEQSGDVYENKGPAFHGRSQSRNVVENKGSYAPMAGMLLKRKAGFRIHASGVRKKFRQRVSRGEQARKLLHSAGQDVASKSESKSAVTSKIERTKRGCL
jgi:hypothetical protein